MTELQDTQMLSAEEVAAITGEAEEADESGAPERVAETDEERPLQSPYSIHHPQDIEDAEEAERAPQPGLTRAPSDADSSV